jgi:hypothetical protein
MARWRDVGAVQHIDRERIGGLHIHGWMPKRLASSVYGVYALMSKVFFLLLISALKTMLICGEMWTGRKWKVTSDEL